MLLIVCRIIANDNQGIAHEAKNINVTYIYKKKVFLVSKISVKTEVKSFAVLHYIVTKVSWKALVINRAASGSDS